MLDVLGNSFLPAMKAKICCKEDRITLENQDVPLTMYRAVTSALSAAVQTAVDDRVLSEIKGIINPEVSPEQIERVLKTFEKCDRPWRNSSLGGCTVEEHIIDTGDARPIAQRARPLHPDLAKEVGRQLEE